MYMYMYMHIQVMMYMYNVYKAGNSLVLNVHVTPAAAGIDPVHWVTSFITSRPVCAFELWFNDACPQTLFDGALHTCACTCMCLYMYMYMYVPKCLGFIFLRSLLACSCLVLASS